MKRGQVRVLMATFVLCLISFSLVHSAAVPDTQGSQTVERSKRSMLWRWITLRALGATCIDNTECSTNYCRDGKCSFQELSSQN
nr:PREDICTED: liver-expressed antimicrobial peptide 2-like [Latimeria chalumnae]|eukprot:XP_014339298.1 PREDICTED: liver-expressed antimicrobial peptide 2-like [Latimeria chalumnae]